MNSNNVHQETLVFLHYFGGSAQSWQWVIERLASEYKCVAFDLPGFGHQATLPEISIQTMSDYVCGTLKKQWIGTCTIVGHSMGAKIALHVAATCKDIQFDQAILVAPSPPTFEPMTAEDRKEMLKLPTHENSIKSVRDSSVVNLSEDKFNSAVANRLQSDPAAWRWWILEGMQHSIEELLPRIECPVTVLASHDDPVIEPATIQTEVMDKMPKASLRWTEQVGHLIPLEAPDWLATQISQAMRDNKNNRLKTE